MSRRSTRARLLTLLGFRMPPTAGGQAAVKPRVVLILPYQNVTPGGGDGWFGEGIAETLALGSRITPALLPIEAGRVVQAAKSANIELGAAPGDRAAAALGKALRADVVFFGEYQRTADGGMSIVPRLMIEGSRPEGQTLEALVAAPDRVVETQGEILALYVKALKLGLKPDEVARMTAAARPTTNLMAFEAYARGRRSFLRGGQDGFEGA